MTVTLKLADIANDSHTRRSLADVSLSVAKCKKIVVITGAGISCSCGIPDFRSSDGLYALVKQQYPDVVLKGRDLFDASLFRDATSTAVFYTFVSKLKQSIDEAFPSPTHNFIKTLDVKKKLLRSYTQNIDGLEERVGLMGSSSSGAKIDGRGKFKIKTKDVRNVQLHGDIHSVRCASCSAEYPCTKEHVTSFLGGIAPNCPECTSRFKERAARSARAIRVGTLRPAIVLYDESHPLGDEIGTIQSRDLSRKPDMLIIMGTSLKVHGLRKMVREFAKTVHTSIPSSSTSTTKSWKGKVVFVNKTPPSSEWNEIIDYHIEGDTDTWVEKVVEDWKKTRPADWEIQQTLIASGEDIGTYGGFKVVKDGLTTKSKGKGKVVKKPHLGSENIPPPDLAAMILSTPDTIMKTVAPPLSPSKRGQLVSHYSDIESSPSKKRVSVIRDALKDDEKKLLFMERTNNPPADAIDDVFDISMQDAKMLPTKTIKSKAADSRAQRKVVTRATRSRGQTC